MKKQSHVLSQSLHSALFGFLSFLFSTLILAFFATLAHCAEVTLAWDANTEPVAGYKVYYKTGSSGEPYDGTGAAEDDSPIDVGNVTTYMLHGLADDVTYFFVVTAYDTEGLESDYSNEVTLSGGMDPPPGAPTVSGTTPTNDTTPTWSWSSGGGGNGTYRYKLDNSNLSSGATQTTATSYTPSSALSEGSHTLYVQERDAAGDWSSSGSFTIVIDTSPPGAPSVSGITPTNDTDPTWSWSSGGGGNGTYRYKLDNSNLSSGATQTTATSYTPSSALSEGSHTLYVQERDGTGNWSSSGSFTIVIDTTSPGAPTVSGTTPTNDTTPTWSWSSGGGGNGTYRYKLDNSNLSSGATQTTSTTYTPSSALSEGSHTLYVQERDGTGNWSSSGSFTIVIDITEPSDPVITTDGGSGPGSDYSTTDSSLTLQGSCAGDTLAIYVNGSTDGVTYTPGETSWTYTGTLESGENTLNITAEDTAGNVSDAGSITVTYSVAAPIVTGETPTNDTTPTWSWSSTPSEVTLDNGAAGSSSTGTWRLSGGPNPYGDNSLYSNEADATYTFEAGLNGSYEVSLWWTYHTSRSTDVPVEVYDGDTLLDTVYINQLENGGQWNVLGTYVFNGTARIVIISEDGSTTSADAVRLVGTGTFRYKLDNDDLTSGATETTDTSYTPDTPLSEGSHTLYVQERDGAGNWSSSGSLAIVIDIDDVLVVGVDNTAPTIQNYPTIDHDNNTIDITFSETDMQNVTDEASYRFSPSLNFATPLVDGDDIINPSGSTYRLTMASIPAYTILTLTVSNITDAAGNPVTPSSITINDNDGDDMADDWEVAYGLDPNDSTGVNASDGDFDNDGWTNYEEWVNGTDPVDDTSFPALSPPDIIETLPHDGAGISDYTRVPNITSFCVRIEDSDGIDITDTESITFTINDGVNEAYTRDLGDTKLVRVVKLTEDEDTQVTRLWVVYDRFMEDEFGNYDYDTQINIKVHAKDTRGGPIDPAPSYTFKIESETQHDYAQDPDNLPDTGEVASDDPDLEDPEYSYNAGVQVNSGDLEGAKIVYDSDEPLTPRFGPRDEIPSFDLEGEGGEGVPVNLQPPTVFNSPVKIFIPYPGYTDVSGLSIFVYKATSWVLACDSSGNVQPGGDGWMVPGSRVNHNNGIPSTIEIKVYHFSAVQAGISTSGDMSTPATDAADTDTATASSVQAGAGCFIATATFGSNMDWHVEILSLFRDVYLLPTKLGHVFVDIYHRYSPRPGLQ